tara:strand:- start:560 stop:2818 length:2259 start_codon:yes stop_codon:yes gene_type:complete
MTDLLVHSDEENNWIEFYRHLENIEDSKNMGEEYIIPPDYYEKIEDKLMEEVRHTELFIKDGLFDCDKYFKFIFITRLFSKQKKEGHNPNIPLVVKDFLTWWIEIGENSESFVSNMDGWNNELINDSKVPNYVKVHILSRFVMRRNAALKGRKNFQTDLEIVNETRRALDKASNYLRYAREDSSQSGLKFHKNKFYSANSITALFEIEEVLFTVRTEKDIDKIILMTTKTLGTSLTLRNRIWGAICTFWCNHILWRCFLCKGHIEIANTFKKTRDEIIRQYLPRKFTLELSGVYAYGYDGYSDSIAKNYWQDIKYIINRKDIPNYTKKINYKFYKKIKLEDSVVQLKKLDLAVKELDEKIKPLHDKIFQEGSDLSKIEKMNRQVRKELLKIAKKDQALVLAEERGQKWLQEMEKEKEGLKENLKNKENEIKNAKQSQDKQNKEKVQELEKERKKIKKDIHERDKKEKEDYLYLQRKEFYTDFIGLEKENLDIVGEGRGRRSSLFSWMDRDRFDKENKEKIYKFMKEDKEYEKEWKEMEEKAVAELHENTDSIRKYMKENNKPKWKEMEKKAVVELRKKGELKGIWEKRIVNMPKFLNRVFNYLEKSSSIVSIPTLRLVIFDVLLSYSRILVSLNPEEAYPQKKSLENSNEIERLWEVVKDSLNEIYEEIARANNHIKMLTGEQKLVDLDEIMKVIKEIMTKGKTTDLQFKGEDGKRPVINSRKAGIRIQELLKDLINDNGSTGVELHFPMKS